MTPALSYQLVSMLKAACPVDTGQLRGSIQPVQMVPNQMIVIIGNSTAAMRTVPSNVYAAFTNNAKTLKSGKPNPNYHWANDAIEKWAKQNALNLVYETEEEEE